MPIQYPSAPGVGAPPQYPTRPMVKTPEAMTGQALQEFGRQLTKTEEAFNIMLERRAKAAQAQANWEAAQALREQNVEMAKEREERLKRAEARQEKAMTRAEKAAVQLEAKREREAEAAKRKRKYLEEDPLRHIDPEFHGAVRLGSMSEGEAARLTRQREQAAVSRRAKMTPDLTGFKGAARLYLSEVFKDLKDPAQAVREVNKRINDAQIKLGGRLKLVEEYTRLAERAVEEPYIGRIAGERVEYEPETYTEIVQYQDEANRLRDEIDNLKQAQEFLTYRYPQHYRDIKQAERAPAAPAAPGAPTAVAESPETVEAIFSRLPEHKQADYRRAYQEAITQGRHDDARKILNKAKFF